MNKADVMQAIFEMARMDGGSESAEEALERIAALVVGLDPARSSYPRDMEALLSIGAFICQARQAGLRVAH